MLITDTNSRDFDLNYEGCFTYLKDDRIPIKIQETAPGVKGYLVTFAEFNKKGKVPRKVMQKDADLKIASEPLSVGTINLPSSVIVLSQRSQVPSPWRYRRLPNQHSINFFDPFVQERVLLKARPIASLENPILLQSWVNNKYVPAQEALENVLQFKRISQAFSPKYYFGINYKNNCVCLYKDKYIIGKVDRNKVVLLKPSAIPLTETLNEFGLITKELLR